ncbi:MAG: hypothetical protein Q7J07_05270 [Pelolinea sp.]|nr:hypothetical protein [Pelolinea sp.]
MFNEIDWLPALTFVLITALTPGPNNLSSASMGVLHGYRSRSIMSSASLLVSCSSVSSAVGWQILFSPSSPLMDPLCAPLALLTSSGLPTAR